MIRALFMVCGLAGCVSSAVFAQSSEEIGNRAVELIERQIRSATTAEESIWVSQPGALRTFGAVGYPSRIYKLYSAPRMVVGASDDVSLDVPVTWKGMPDHFVDLNVPVGGVFPIVNPAAEADGFSFTPGTEGVAVDRLPMPVSWLYVLKDGTTGTLNTMGTFIGEKPATLENPMVGRMAFWTDDETCKLNINTASEGEYWDVPRVDSTEDRALGQSPPQSDEYWKVPGHPARVCLSPALLPGRESLTESERDMLRGLGEGISLTAEVEARLRAGDFFLTKSSNAPELNLFGKPRFSMWPLQADRGGGLLERAYSAASTLGGTRYAVLRYNSTSHHNEYYDVENRERADYLTATLDQIPPSFPQSLAAKFGEGPSGDAAQLAHCAMGYFRSWIEPAWGAVHSNGEVNHYCACGGSASHVSRFTNPAVLRPVGVARLPVISEISLHLVCSAENSVTRGARGSAALLEGLPLGTKRISLGLMIEQFWPGSGFPGIDRTTYIEIGGNASNSIAPSFLLNDEELGFDGVVRVHAAGLRPGDYRIHGGQGGPRVLNESCPWWEGVIVDENAAVLNFGGVVDGSEVVLKINKHDQAVRFSPPAAPFPVPEYAGPETISERRLLGESDKSALIRDGDVVRSMVVRHGDYRLTAGTLSLPGGAYVPHPDYFELNRPLAHALTYQTGELAHGGRIERELIPGAGYAGTALPDFPLSPDNPTFRAAVPAGYAFSIDPAVTGDWDNGMPTTPDGAFLNRPDESPLLGDPFFAGLNRILRMSSQNPPHKAIPSAGMLGSLPTGTKAGIPWRTLLFRPQTDHFGAGGTPDHLFMDLFWHPVLGPKPISHDFSTDGKINLNCGIVPFDYIKRQTALHGLLKTEKVMAIPTDAGGIYKTGAGDVKWRHKIDVEETLRQCDGKIFRTATELCEQHLVPEGQTVETMEVFWQAHKLTGDNTKERPYANLYGLTTTQSNRFTAYIIAETIRKSPNTPANRFISGVDEAEGRYQGKVRLARWLDTGAAELPDYLDDPFDGGLESFYLLETDRLPLEADFQILDFKKVSAGSVMVTCASQTGRRYQAEVSSDLRGWITSGGVVIAGGATVAVPVQGANYIRIRRLQ